MKTNKMHTFHTDVLIYRENPSTGYTAYINAWKYATKKNCTYKWSSRWTHDVRNT